MADVRPILPVSPFPVQSLFRLLVLILTTDSVITKYSFIGPPAEQGKYISPLNFIAEEEEQISVNLPFPFLPFHASGEEKSSFV